MSVKKNARKSLVYREPMRKTLDNPTEGSRALMENQKGPARRQPSEAHHRTVGGF